jgi:hypothetical protein
VEECQLSCNELASVEEWFKRGGGER